MRRLLGTPERELASSSPHIHFQFCRDDREGSSDLFWSCHAATQHAWFKVMKQKRGEYKFNNFIISSVSDQSPLLITCLCWNSKAKEYPGSKHLKNQHLYSLLPALPGFHSCGFLRLLPLPPFSHPPPPMKSSALPWTRRMFLLWTWDRFLDMCSSLQLHLQPQELASDGSIPGAVNIPLKQVGEVFSLPPDQWESLLGLPPPRADSPIIFSCLAGIRSHKAQVLD